MRLRSDEQLVTQFRDGNEEAFRVIHDRYRQRLHAYSRQMLAGSDADAEDVVQEIFVKAYGGLRASHRELALRAWLYRVAHNRCIDEIRRPQPATTEATEHLAATTPEPLSRIEQRDALRRLIADVRRLPDQQRSALLMRELGGMAYCDVAEALSVTVPAVKSLLVRARVGLAQAGEARDASCTRIREDLIVSHDRGVRASGLARRHMRDCTECREFRTEVRGVSRQFAALVPALGPIGVIAKLLGVGGAGGGGAAAGTGAVATSGAAAGGTGAVTSIAAVAGGAGHMVTILAAAVVTAGGAIELQQISPPVAHHARHHHVASPAPARGTSGPSATTSATAAVSVGSPAGSTSSTSVPASTSAAVPSSSAPATEPSSGSSRPTKVAAPAEPAETNGPRRTLPISEIIDPDNLGSSPSTDQPGSGTTPTATPTPAPSAQDPTTTPTSTTPTSATPPAPVTTPISTVPTTGSGVAPTSGSGTTTSPAGTQTPTGATGTAQSPSGVAPLSETSKQTASSSGRVVLGAAGASTRKATVRVYKSVRR